MLRHPLLLRTNQFQILTLPRFPPKADDSDQVFLEGDTATTSDAIPNLTLLRFPPKAANSDQILFLECDMKILQGKETELTDNIVNIIIKLTEQDLKNINRLSTSILIFSTYFLNRISSKIIEVIPKEVWWEMELTIGSCLQLMWVNVNSIQWIPI